MTIKIIYQGYHGNQRETIKEFQDNIHLSNYIRIMQKKGCKNIRTYENY